MTNKHTIWLIDSSIYVFKAWHTRAETLNKNNQSIEASLGFLDFVYQFLTELKPTQIAFAFDESLENNFRKKVFPDYKANRTPAPESLKLQFALCRQFLSALGIYHAASHTHEADDLIGSWSETFRNNHHRIAIISADKDLAQLVQEHDVWWDYPQKTVFNYQKIYKKFGVKPEQIAAQLAIAGDKSDNIPGVPGIGMATAAKLLNKFHSVDTLLKHTDKIASMQIRHAKHIQTLIMEHKETIRLSLQLTKIDTRLNITHHEDLYIRNLNMTTFNLLCDILELDQIQRKKWIKLHQSLTNKSVYLY